MIKVWHLQHRDGLHSPSCAAIGNRSPPPFPDHQNDRKERGRCLAIVSVKNGQGKTFRLRPVSITLASKATTRLPSAAAVNSRGPKSSMPAREHTHQCHEDARHHGQLRQGKAYHPLDGFVLGDFNLLAQRFLGGFNLAVQGGKISF